MQQTSKPTVTILILTWNGQQLLSTCLPPLIAQEYPTLRIVVVDNASTDDSIEFVRREFPQVEIIQNDANLGFAKGFNAAIRQFNDTFDDYTILMNNDVIVPSDWLTTFVAEMDKVVDLGVAGCKLLYPDGTIQHLGAELSFPLAYSKHTYAYEEDAGQVTAVTDVDYVTGAVFALPRQTLQTVGLFDEQFSPFYMEEVDYCFRARDAGLRVVVIPQATAIHDESSSTKKVEGLQLWANNINRLRFIVKHYSTEQFLKAFVPAEKAHTKASHSNIFYRLRRNLYLEMAFELHERLAGVGRSADLGVMQGAFMELHRFIVDLEPVGFSAERDSLQKEWLEQSNLKEHEFTSSIPLISQMRTMWHNVAGKWALRKIVQQQSEFNQLTIQLLTTILATQQVNSVTQQVNSIELNRLSALLLQQHIAQTEKKHPNL